MRAALLDELVKHLQREKHNRGFLLFLFPIVQSVECVLYLLGSGHESLHLELLKYVLYFGVVFQQVRIDFRCALLQLVGAAVLYPLLVGIPFGDIYAVARCELDAVAGENHTHTDRDILHDWHSVFLAAFQSKNDVSFYIHNWVRLKFNTQIYTQ